MALSVITALADDKDTHSAEQSAVPVTDPRYRDSWNHLASRDDNIENKIQYGDRAWKIALHHV